MELLTITSLNDINLSTLTWSDLVDFLSHQALDFGQRLLICIVIYIVGKKLIRFLNKALGKLMNSRKLDASVISFLNSLIDILLTVVLLITIINILGINNSSFIALFASFGVAMGMALSGTMQNFAGGVMILLFRPYKIGDYIQAQGQEGTVKSIQIFSTVLTTLDNRTIYVPNGGLSNNIIVNFNNQDTRRIEWTIGIEYGTDYDKAKSILQSILSSDKRIFNDPSPYIAMKALSESSVDLLIRAWATRSDYWDIYYDINEQIYKVFEINGINIPFPNVTVHLSDNSKSN
ncbi:MAG: mechanosensitive ion channel [Candidatus Azobacteroides sp.]|nr:mechanosensitive ion channel [Candidatus Azobacteroides sp.]